MAAFQQKEFVNVGQSLRGRDKTKCYQLRGVQTVKSLNLPKQSLDYAKVADQHPYLRGLPVQSYSMQQPALLIGVNNWHVGVPRRVRADNDGGPIAVKCDLGWSVFAGDVDLNAANVHHCQIETDDEFRELSMKDMECQVIVGERQVCGS